MSAVPTVNESPTELNDNTYVAPMSGPLTVEEMHLVGILTDRSGIDIAQFVMVDEEQPDRIWRARPYQYSWWRSYEKYEIDYASRDIGKRLHVDTPIATPDGWTTMGALQEGDVIFGSEGQPTTVLQAHPIEVAERSFKVVFDDGEEILADAEHLWSASVGGRRPQVVTTEQIRLSIEDEWRIPVTAPLELPTLLSVKTGPYVVGRDLGERDIPNEFLRASIEQRTLLLHGLLASKGYRHREITLSHRAVAEQTLELVRSLGYKPYRREWSDEEGYRLEWPPVRRAHRRIVSIDPVDPVEMRCITVDAPNHLYLCGRGMIPTHNTAGSIIRALAWPFCFPGRDIMYTAPELNHLRPLCDGIEEALLGHRLTREMLRGGGGRSQRAITRVPAFTVHFTNRARIITRLPGKTGRGVKGQHALCITIDEGQDYPERGYTEIIEAMKSSNPGAQFKIHGVSNGDNGRFDKYLTSNDPNLPFKRHRFVGMDRPTWNDDERRAKISQYGGSEDSIDYQRNLFGVAGNTSTALLSQRRLMACTRIKESAWAIEYNREVYRRVKISEEHLRGGRQVLQEAFDQLPVEIFSDQYVAYYGGMDVGFVRDPTEILIFGLLRDGTLRLLLRVHLARITGNDQAFVVRSLFHLFGDRLLAFGMDRTGVGLPVYQDLVDPYSPEAMPEHMRARVLGYAAQELVPVGMDDRELLPYETEKDLLIWKSVTAWGFDEIRSVVDHQQVELPYDHELLAELQGEIAINTKGGEQGAVRRRSGHKISLHTLDAFLLMLAARSLPEIARQLMPAQGDVLEDFRYASGW